MMPGCRPGVYVCVIKLMRSCEYVLPCMYWHSAETSRMALPYTCMESSFLPLSFALDIASLHDLQKLG